MFLNALGMFGILKICYKKLGLLHYWGEARTMANKARTLDKYTIKISDHFPYAFCLVRVDLDEQNKPRDWTLLHCNDALAKLEGMPKEDLIGMHFYEVFPEESKKWLQPCYESAYNDKANSFEVISDEIGRYLRIETFPTNEAGVCVCVLRDIKKRSR